MNNMEKRTIEVSLATAKKWYKRDNQELRNLALQVFDKKELQNYCVRSWEEFCEQYNNIDNEYFIDSLSDIDIIDNGYRDADKNRNLLVTKEDTEAFLALMQLKRLRDQWWETLDWKPECSNDPLDEYIIIPFNNKITINASFVYSRFLSFPSKEIAEDFLNCFKDLINKAKELL